jgi:hypothetical protein
MTATKAPTTLYDKIWDDHVVDVQPDGTCAPLHRPPPRPRGDEPAGLRGAAHHRPQGSHAPQKTLAVVDHNVPTTDRSNCPNRRSGKRRSRSRRWPRTPASSASSTYNEFDKRQGIVHIVGPEQGFTLPGITLVCGDSHTSTHGALRLPRLRHRHLGGRARARDADADPEEGQEHARRRRRRAGFRRHRQGCHPRHHRRRSAPPAAPATYRICRRGDPGNSRWKAA